MASILGLTYGVRSTFQSGSDYHQHSAHVKKRVAKLKKDLGIQVHDTKHYQDKDKTFEINADNYSSDEAYGLVLLYLAERDLSRALEVSTISEVSSSKSKEKFIVSKLKRSLQYVKQLIDVSFSEKDDSKKVELYVYYALIQGLLAVRQKKWTLAGYALSIARNSLEFLESFSEYQQNKTSHLYREIIESSVDPSLKLTINHSSLDKQRTGDLNIVSKVIVKRYRSSPPDDTYDELIELIDTKDKSYLEVDESKESTSANRLIDEITWSSYTAKLHNSDIARSIMSVQSQETKIDDKDISSFDPVLLGWQEILESHEADTERVTALGVEDADEIRDRQVVLTFIKYNSYFNKIRRDLALISSLNNKKLKNLVSLVDINRDILRIYEMIAATVTELKDLPGVYSDQDLYNDIETLETYFQSSKLYIISKVYEVAKKYKESLLILKTISDKLSLLDILKSEFPGNVLNNDKLSALTKEINSAKVKVHVLAQFEHESLENQSSVTSVADAANITVSINTLGEIKKSNKLIDIDAIKPVSVKPVFFDLAFNYVGENEESISEGTDEKVKEQSTTGSAASAPIDVDNKSEQKPKKKGLFGLWG